jgi:molybdopterin molybdotransferase
MIGRWNYRTLEQAVYAVTAHSARIRRTEVVPIDSSIGRVLAQTVRGRVDVPPWDRSTVDGYAVRSADTAEGRSTVLKVIGHVSAGGSFRGRVGRGECVGIATGAPMPEGSDAAIMFERLDEDRDAGRISFSFRVQRGENVSFRGADIGRGDVVAMGGRRITAGILGALASQGMASVRVLAKPAVAVIPGGDEISPVGRKARKGQIYDVNSHTIASVIERCGGRAVIAHTVADEIGEVRRALLSALKHDACVFASGSSAGSRDFVAGVIAKEGRLLFHGVRIRPGRPTMFGVVRGKPVFGLAGHPVSSFLGAYYLLGPSVRKMSGIGNSPPHTVTAVFSGESRGDDTVERLIPVKLEDGRCVTVFKESGAITSISRADGIVRQPAGRDIADGESVKVELLNGC